MIPLINIRYFKQDLRQQCHLHKFSRQQVTTPFKRRLWHSYCDTESRCSTVTCAQARKTSKGPTTVWRCTECGHVHPKHYGECWNCKARFTLEETENELSDGAMGGGAGVAATHRAASKSQVRQLLARASADLVNEGGMMGDSGSSGYGGSASGWSTDGGQSGGRVQGWVRGPRSAPKPQNLPQLAQAKSQRKLRLSLSGRTGEEINRVLGGGVVHGSLVLVGGDPGVGKSTLLLQIAAMLAQPNLDFDSLNESDDEDLSASMPAAAPPQPHAANGSSALTNGASALGTEKGAARRVLYVSGEEMEAQIYDRAHRMALSSCDSLYVLAECRMEEVLAAALELNPVALVVDSIQTMYLEELPNGMGSVVQLKECGMALLRLAKDQGITVFVIGHVTKGSEIAGPKALEHMVDCVLRMEGDSAQACRLLRCTKNRYGNTDEVGVFRMDPAGMHAMDNPSAHFLAARSASAVSSAVAVTMDGSRLLAMEVQALVTPQPQQATSPPMRQASGVAKERLGPIIVNVLTKFVVRMTTQNVVVSVTGGMQLREPAADLAIAVAITSSHYNIAVPRDVAVIGEIDLGGGLRPVRCMDLRLLELTRLGIRRAVIPRSKDVDKLLKGSSSTRFKDLEVVQCGTLLEALRAVLGPEVGRSSTWGGSGSGRWRSQGTQQQAALVQSRGRAQVQAFEEDGEDGEAPNATRWERGDVRQEDEEEGEDESEAAGSSETEEREQALQSPKGRGARARTHRLRK